jgi:hypothetical protein
MINYSSQNSILTRNSGYDLQLRCEDFTLNLSQDKHNMKLDHRSHLFQNLNGAEGLLKLTVKCKHIVQK